VLEPTHQTALFDLVRAAIAARLAGDPPPPLPAGPPEFSEPRGVFVTLRQPNGELRGCIGYTEPRLPLAEAVRELAVRAAFHDPRFPPLKAEEQEGLQLELSVLTPLEPADPERIEVGVHGLQIRYAGRAGLLLPQVASSRGWDAETFLQHTCVKAGLPPEAWREPGAEVLWFRCEIYPPE